MRKLISRFGLALLGLGISILPAGAATYSLSTSITYSGRQTGDVWVVASTIYGLPPYPFSTARLSVPANAPFTNAAVTLTNLFPGVSYYVLAWRDSIPGSDVDATEAQGWHSAGPFLITTTNLNVSGFAITDPDNNGDGLPDWWEAKYGLPTYPGSGRDGALTIGPGETRYTDTLWAGVVGSNPANTSTLNISTNRGFASNDVVLIVTMQDPNTNNWALNKAGTFEFGRVQSASMNSLTLRMPHTNNFTVATTEKIQVLKVPEYTDVTLGGSEPALSFDGVDDTARLASGVYFNDNFTIESWVCPQAYSTWARVVDMSNTNGGAGINECVILAFADGSGNLCPHLRIGLTTLQTTAILASNQWVHLAATLNGTNATIYANGVVIGNASGMSVPVNVVRTNTRFGASNSPGEPRTKAKLAYLSLWNVARSQAEIQADMNHKLAGTEPGLVAYYLLNEGTGTTILDATGHGYNGALTGSPAWVSGPPSGLTCQPWDGSHGGVLAFLARSVTLGTNSVISADGKGYRGGSPVPSENNWQWGMAGERTSGFSSSRETDSLERRLGGGGAGLGADGSGGGGCYGSIGANGTYGLGGSLGGGGATNLYGYSDLSRLLPGGGGGGSGSHSYYLAAPRAGVGGGAGGGVVFIAAGSVGGAGTISSRGMPGQSGMTNGTVDPNQASGGGGGAGGSVNLVGNIASSIQLLATGGAGGARHPVATNSKDGGAGGVGRIRLDLPLFGAQPANALPTVGYTNQSLAGLSLLPGGDAYDSDQDGLTDLREYQLNTSPINPDTDGDGLPDWWETAYMSPTNSLNPASFNDPLQDSDGDGVCDLVEYYRGTLPNSRDSDGDGLSDYEELFIYHTDPLKQDTDGDGVSDFAEVKLAGTDPLVSGIQYTYDSLGRLLGAQYENGFWLGYQYDGNNNLTCQVYGMRNSYSNAVPDLWRFNHGLTNNPSAYTDTDGDGWSDYEEWLAGTDPRDPNSAPNVLGCAGANIASLAMSFTPTNFVVGVGQLAGLSAEVIVIGADGNPGANTNFLLVLSQSMLSGTNLSWTTQRVDVGRFGVTSIALGQPANRPSPAIYLGLRQADGTGRVMEVAPSDGIWTPNVTWTSNIIATNTSDAAFVLGVRPGRDVVVTLAQTNAPPGTPYYLAFPTNSWFLTRADTDTSAQRGLGTVTRSGLHGLTSRGVRLLDAGGLEVLRDAVFVPTNAIWNPNYSRWFFITPSAMTWEGCESYAESVGGNLATVSDADLDAWLFSRFNSYWWYWIGLHQIPPVVGPWIWASGASVTYRNWWANSETNQANETAACVNAAGTWYSNDPAGALRGVVELPGSVSAAEPTAFSRVLWRGQSLCSGDPRLLTTAMSVVYAYVDDWNRNGVVDAGDYFVVAEYLIDSYSIALNDVERVPLTGAGLAQSYGLACLDVLSGNQQMLFTAEPDGRIFSWAATNTTPALQRQLFSAYDRGKAWHALTAARTLDAAQSLVGLRVDPAAPSRCDIILWPPQTQLNIVSALPQTPPVTGILPTPNLGRDLAQVKIRLWDEEGSPSRPELNYLGPGQSIWSNATIAALDGTTYGYVATHPTGLVHTVTWNAKADLGPGFTNTVTLRARALELSLTGEWSPPVNYVVQNSISNIPPPTIVLQAPWLFGRTQFSMTISGIAGQVYRVQASTNLMTWFDVWTLSNATGTVPFTELVPTNAPARFYRAVLLP